MRAGDRCRECMLLPLVAMKEVWLENLTGAVQHRKERRTGTLEGEMTSCIACYTMDHLETFERQFI